MTTLLSFLFVLGVLIFIHELGHFAVAKLLGIRVEK
jgi:regulator of sigma E protease